MAVSNYQDLILHTGHTVAVVTYGYGDNGEDAANVAIECEDCNEVLIDFDRPDMVVPQNGTD